MINEANARDKLYKYWKRRPSDRERERLYKINRNKVTKLMFTAKNNYYKRKFQDSNLDIRKICGIADEVLGRKTNNIDEIIMHNFNGNDEQIANNFAEYFEKVSMISYTIVLKKLCRKIKLLFKIQCTSNLQMNLR